jgi:GTP-binding protein HflX
VIERSRTGERAVLVRLGLGAPIDPEDLEEFTQLATSAGAIPVATITARRARPDSKFFVGSGKADELRDAAAATDADLILVDHQLSPSQERNLEEHTGRRVLDRNGLILDIFAQRARSLEGKLEVELAQLKHLASRLVRGWTHLERQKGGIGMRGPGETQLETDRRLLGQRVKVLGKRLERIQLQRETGRQTRMQIPVPTLALVGYTNAGKSTLFRTLTGAPAYVADQLFATLDPTVRRIRLPGGTPAVVADTVGFIRELPHELIAAFRSTLTEAREATVLLHVVDASDPRRSERMEQVNAVLEEIGAGEIPQILVYNKIDRLATPPRLERDADGRVSSVWISAALAQGVPLLAEAITERISRTVYISRVRIPPAAGQLRSRLYARGVVKQEHVLEDGQIELLLELPNVDLLELARAPGVVVVDSGGAGAPCTAGPGYLQSAPPASATKLS